MTIALSTRWNASHHRNGEELVQEILDLGITSIELGYNLTMDLVPGVSKMIEEKAVNVTSVHNFCPVPVGVSRGHPELFLMASDSQRDRESAVNHTSRTLELAAKCGASAIVVHAGYVKMPKMTSKLITLMYKNEQHSRKFEKTKMKLMLQREKKVGRYLDNLSRCLEKLVPEAENAGIFIALENLPTWEAVPNESEMEEICKRFPSAVAYWHDTGHAQVRQNLGFGIQKKWIEKLAHCTAGYHIHDTDHCANDHIMPPRGCIGFDAIGPVIQKGKPLVLEPRPGTPADEITTAVEFLENIWQK